jgi:hypothetical protein
MNHASSVFELDDQVITEQIGDEMILLDLKGERYLSVDRIGQEIWALLAQGANASSVVDSLEAKYHVDRSVLTSDVEKFVAKLLDLGLVRAVA